MARLAKHVLARVHSIEAELRTVVDGGTSALAMITEALPDLVGVGQAFSYTLAPRGEAMRVERAFVAGFSRDAIRAFDEYLARAPVSWTWYNPMRPEPEQQNLAVYWESLRRLLRMPRSTPRGSPVLREVFSRFGLGDVDNLRVIVCDGPSLLAYVGAFQSDGFDDTQRRTLQRLVPALKRRLIVERLLLQGDTSRAMFDAAFSAIPSAAFVTDAQGTLRELNAAGSAWFEHDARAVRDALRVAVKRGGSPRFAVTRIVAGGAPNLRLVVQVRGGDLSSAHRSRAAAARWSFTARQAQVLALLVDGSTTRTIAAELAVSEKTIEAHLTAMFDKAQVGSRAALVAAAWRQA